MVCGIAGEVYFIILALAVYCDALVKWNRAVTEESHIGKHKETFISGIQV